MLEREQGIVERYMDAIKFYENLMRDALSIEPGTTGYEIRKEVLDSDDALRLALSFIAGNQMFENQIDPDGHKMPKYKPSTIRKKAQLPGRASQHLTNYTQLWTGAFYEHGIYIAVDADLKFYYEKLEDETRFPHFKYIPDEYVGMTQENEEKFEEILSREVTRRQWRYIYSELNRSGYSEIIDTLRFIGYEFDI